MRHVHFTDDPSPPYSCSRDGDWPDIRGPSPPPAAFRDEILFRPPNEWIDLTLRSMGVTRRSSSNFAQLSLPTPPCAGTRHVEIYF